MSALMFGVGIFVIGAFLVVLPIVNRDVYGFGSDGIRDMFVTFWMGAFVSSLVLSVFKRIKRQGRLLLTAQVGSQRAEHYISKTGNPIISHRNWLDDYIAKRVQPHRYYSNINTMPRNSSAS